MDFLGKLFSSSAGGFVESVGSTVHKFITTDKEREEFKIQLEALLQKRDAELEETLRTELKAKERIMVAEMQSGDRYTMRARPTIVYFGLLAIMFNFCFIPLVKLIAGSPDFEPFSLPEEFWWAWGSVVSAYSIGVSVERTGFRNRVLDKGIGAVTGSNQTLKNSFFDEKAQG